MKRIVALAVVSVLAVLWLQQEHATIAPAPQDASSPRQAPAPQHAPVATPELIGRDASGRMLAVSGVVDRILSDDHDGSRHQRFILRMNTGQTLLVAHNIDLAPRLEGLRPGERLDLYGQYEWNERGGLMHWTHHDPDGSHPGGYIERQGRRYQ